jgi:hypothetical protein
MINRKSKIENRKSRRLWQRAIRLAALLLLAVTVLYVSLPWWMPRDLLRQAIEGRLSRQLGVGVTVASLNVSWDQGLELGDLSVASPDGRAEPMMQVSRVRADFSPLRMLFTNKIAWLQVEGLRIFARMDSQGNFNLAPLGRLNADLRPRRIGVTNATCTLRLPDSEKLLRLGVSSLEIVEGRTTAMGAVTMSAQLAQDGSSAPLSLAATAGGNDAAASGKFSFSNMDLGQLPLPALLGLPLDKLAGRCSGSLDLRLSDQGQIDRFGLDLDVKGLDVQPTCGPQLPVIDDATVRLSASYDIINSQIQVQSAYGKLPGVEFWASGLVSTDLASGAWEAIRQLDLRAKVCPSDICALCRRELPAGLTADGITEINIAAGGDQRHLTLKRLAVDATGNCLRQGQQVLKPAGTRLALEADATLDKNTWGLRTSACAIVVGANRVCGSCAIGSVKQLWDQLSQPDIGNDPRWPGRLCGNFQCSAQCELADIQCLRRLAEGLSDPLARALADVRLAGAVEGKIELAGPAPVGANAAPGAAQTLGATAAPFDFGELNRAAAATSHQPRFRLELSAPAATALTFGHVFAKPAGSPLTLTVLGTVAPDQWALQDVLIDFARGVAFARLLEGQVQKLPRDQWAISLIGRIDIDDAKPLVQLFPAAADCGATIDGDIDGNCKLTFGGSSVTSDFDLDFSQASVTVGDFLKKPLGQAGGVKMSSQFRTGQGGGLDCPFAKLSFDSPQAAANVEASGTWAAGSLTGLDAKASASVKDCGWLFTISPKLARAIPDIKISGPVEIGGGVSLRQDRCQGSVSVQADAMDVSSAGPAQPAAQPAPQVAAQVAQPFQAVLAQFHKRARCPLALVATGWAQLDACKQAQLELTSAELTLAGCIASASGKATFKPGDATPKPGSGLDQLLSALDRHEIASLDAQVKASAALDEAMADLNPRIRQTLDQFGISGRLLAQARVHADADELTLTAGIDAGKLAAAHADWLAKSADIPCQAQLELTAQRPRSASDGSACPSVLDISYIHLNNLHLALGPVDLLASGDLDKEGWLTISRQVCGFATRLGHGSSPAFPICLLWAASADRPFKTLVPATPAAQPGKERNRPQVAISVADASRLAAISPALAPYRLQGKAALDLGYSIDGGGLANLSFHADNLRATLGGKDLSLDGPLLLGNVRLQLPLSSQAATIGTDGLEFRIGDNHGWLIADLKDFPKAAASGLANGNALQLICEKLDDKDLSAWLAGPTPQPQLPCLAQTQPEHPCYNLPAARANELRQGAARLFQSARPYLLAADLQARVSIAHLHDYDAAVDHAYDMNDVQIAGTLNHGQAALTMLAGLDGGILEMRREVDLGEVAQAFQPVPGAAAAPGAMPSSVAAGAGVSAASQAALASEPVHAQPGKAVLPPNPLVKYYTQYRGVLATPAFQPQLAMFFPGNTFSGQFSRTETVTVPLIEALAKLRDGRFVAKPVGTAGTITTDGAVEGCCAPDFVTRIFPGLNLTRYHYDKMTAFAQFNPDGTADNDMVFNGHPIDMYIEGTTDAANLGHYEIGIILLSAPQTPDWNHKFHQGRIPLLKFKGIIENGRIYDEEVTYPLPNETLFTVFLKNNLLYRAWLDAQQKKK